MTEVVPLELPDPLVSPVLNDSLASPSSAAHDHSLLDISQSFSIDYLNMKHDEEIASIRATLPSPPSPPSSSSPRRPHSATAGGRAKGESHRLHLLAAEKSLLEDRVRMMERLLSKQSSEMEEYVSSTASLYVQLSDRQQQLTHLTHQRDALDTELTTLRPQVESLQRETARAHLERDRERESNERHITALKRELADVRSRWVEGQAHVDRLTDEYAQHEEQYSRRIDELERQRERWEQAERAVADMQGRVDDLRRDNERLKEETVRVGQLTAEVAGMHEVVERIYAERKAYEDERAQWTQDRRDADRRERQLKDDLSTAQLDTEKARRDADAMRRDADELQQRHQRTLEDVEERRAQDREEGARKVRLLKGEVRALREQLQRVQEALDKATHPDHEELKGLRVQLMQAKDECAQLKDRLHSDDLGRLTAEQRMQAQQLRVEQLTAQRSRLIQRVQSKAQQLTVAYTFYQWNTRIQVKRVERRAEAAMSRMAEERKGAVEEERRREKAEVERTLKELEDKVKRLENDRLREEEQRRKDDEQRRLRDTVNASEEERRREREREERRRQREREQQTEERERQRKAREQAEEERELRERQMRAAEEGRQRSLSPQRHHHRHYVSPSTSPAAVPLPFPYHPALSALLALTPSSSSPEDIQLASRMQSLLEKLRALQQMQETKTDGGGHSPVRQMDGGEGGSGEGHPTILPAALLAPPMKAELLPPPMMLPSVLGTWKRGKENRPLQRRRAAPSVNPPPTSAPSSARITATNKPPQRAAEPTTATSRSRSRKEDGGAAAEPFSRASARSSKLNKSQQRTAAVP